MFNENIYGFGPILKEYLEYHKISQSDFAKRIGISQKHMNEILNNRTDISAEIILAINLITDIDIDLICLAEEEKRVNDYLINTFKNEENFKKYLKQFSIKELKEKNWLTFLDEKSLVQIAIDLFKFLSIKDFDALNKYNEKVILYKKKDDADMNKIALWLKHCDNIISNQNVCLYDKNKFNDLILELKKLSLKKFNSNDIIKCLNKYGIYVAIEDALKGTKIRGCSMVKIDNPVIYITKLYKDKASFYFTLFHELGHIKSDYNKAKSKIIIDKDEKLEKRADTFALNTMIDKDVWNLIISNLEKTEDICKKNNIPVSFATTRLAKEGYIKYSSKLYNNNKELIY